MSEKIPLVLFSGGLDSTYTVWKHLRSGQKIDLIYIDGGQSGFKNKKEKQAQENILNEIRRLKKDLPYIHNLAPRVQVCWTPALDYTWCQPLSWILGAMSSVDADRHSCVQISYVQGDGILCRLDEIKKAWNAIWTFSKKGPLVPIEFPLELTSKKEIMAALPRSIYDLTWVCELPRAEYKEDGEEPILHACGRCEPCITRELEEHRYFLMHGIKFKITSSDENQLKESEENVNLKSITKPLIEPTEV